jgi:hypothetical protein
VYRKHQNKRNCPKKTMEYPEHSNSKGRQEQAGGTIASR